MRSFTLALLLVVSATIAEIGPVGAETGGTPPRLFLLDARTLDTIRQRVAAGDPSLAEAMKQLTDAAEAAVNNAPVSVMEKAQLPPSGDKHDYMSLAPYFWPDPAKPDGLPYINRDGERNPEEATIPDKTNYNRMVSSVDTLSLAYYLGGDERYAAQSARLLRTWFLDDATHMNPNLNYAQAVKGVTDGRGIGIIDTRDLAHLVDAIGLIGQSPSWTAADQDGMIGWFGQYLDWLLTSKNGKDEAKAANNHGSWYDVQIVAISLFVGRDDLARRTLQESGAKRIARQIEPDGRQPLELTRTISLHYSVFNLEALCDLATLGSREQIDLWHDVTPDGRGLREALDFVLPAALGQRPWPYPQISASNPAELSESLLQAATAFPDGPYGAAGWSTLGDQAASSALNLRYLRT